MAGRASSPYAYKAQSNPVSQTCQATYPPALVRSEAVAPGWSHGGLGGKPSAVGWHEAPPQHEASEGARGQSAWAP
jgi:hypothetical protein